MARVDNEDLLPAFVMLHGFTHFAEMKSLDQYAKITRQRVSNLMDYLCHYFANRVVLRLEEVLTFDEKRHNNIPSKINEEGVFDQNRSTIICDLLVEKGLIYNFVNWKRYVEMNVSRDLLLLHRLCDRNTDYDDDALPCVSRKIVRNVARAQHRVYFFVHGHDPRFNYSMVQGMYIGRNESSSLDERGLFIRLVEHDNDDANTPCNFHNSVLPRY